MLPHPDASLASVLMRQPPSIDRDAQMLWLASRTINLMIRKGRLDLADILIDEMMSMAADMGSLRHRFMSAANDFALRCTAARMGRMAQ